MAEEGSLASVIAPDLGKQRGLSKATLDLFNVSVNGTGWYWNTKLRSGGEATRWKSFYSRKEDAPEHIRQGWKKYLWIPDRPEGADYLVSPQIVLTTEIKAEDGELWLVGGEIAAMTMIEAGFRNVVCFFGDTNIPDSFTEDVKRWGTKQLFMIPDRDESGQACAYNVRDRLRETDIEFRCYALPYPVGSKKDVNDLWLDCEVDKDGFTRKVLAMELWTLPERKEEAPIIYPDLSSYADSDLPLDFVRDVERMLEVHGGYRADGWSKKPILCPFHDEDSPSAYWNAQKKILKCFGGCAKTYKAKEVGERYGLTLADYYRDAPVMNIIKLPVVTTPEPDFVADDFAAEGGIDTLPGTKSDIDPLRGQNQPAKPIERKYSPALPEEAQLADAQLKEAAKGRIWLDCYVKWACKASPLSPEFFHEALGLWMLATAATRRMKIVIGGENIYPNLYIMIVAPTTAYRKTSALKLTHRILRDAKLDFLLMPERATPEALFEYLAGRLPPNFNDLSETDKAYWSYGRTFAAQRAIIEDEASGLLTEMKKDYMAGLSEILLKGYDGEGHLRKLLKSQGLISVKDACLSFMGATTPVEWSRRMTNEERQNGFVARFAIVTPESAPVYKETEDDIEPPEDVVRGIRRMFRDILPWHDYLRGQDGQPRPLAPGAEVEPPAITTLSVAPEALAQMKAYRKALGFDMSLEVGDEKSGNYARLGTMVYKVAMLLAAVDTFQAPIRIEPRHAYAAQLICERWRESLHRLDVHVSQARHNGNDDRLLHFIKTGGEVGVTARDIHRGCNVDQDKVAMVLKTLVDSGLVEMFKRDGRGRPAIAYRYIAEVK